MSAVQLFISHSERDEQLVRPMTDWLEQALDLTEENLRCTSVYSLESGDFAPDTLRDDLHSAKAVIGVLTANSLRSQWVQFEMGAAWLQQRLYPIRGPGLKVSHLPKPISDFTTIALCDKESMQRLLNQLAEVLGTSINPDAEQKLELTIESAKQALVQQLQHWFSLAPVLSAWRIDGRSYQHELEHLCSELDLRVDELRLCTTSQGSLTRNPEQLPVWAEDIWNVSKDAVNALLDPSHQKAENLVIPPGILNASLIADMKIALKSKAKREYRIRRWFDEAREWISTNPPGDFSDHSGGHP